LDKKVELQKELAFLGLLEKARQIRDELGDRGVLSFLKSSYRLLSKVYHPDLNPDTSKKAQKTQLSLNRVNQLINQMKDEELLEAIQVEPKKPTNRKKKILVVEDEFGLQETFRDIFLMEGYEVKVAVDGGNGYEVYRSYKPDLIFTDVVMPGMNGIELVAKIREEVPDIKVIYISGFFGIKRLKRELNEDMLRFGYPSLSKPFKISDMLGLVHDYLND